MGKSTLKIKDDLIINYSIKITLGEKNKAKSQNISSKLYHIPTV